MAEQMCERTERLKAYSLLIDVNVNICWNEGDCREDDTEELELHFYVILRGYGTKDFC
ncbi:hypothetical protein Ddye_019054 [Dipteronia dyeriana]|uniref:Uncharacterized protein n=1 Tax=Dipteronia dyeriana TaxID=168575 RepID=A0AAD9WU27_9ROSI|nr:hypothetical protein Ddye_019054 [Dipteronia dyeriana]